MDQLDSMRLFVRVAELGSFSAVAQQMNVARSVVTRRIAALETRLGVKLLARSTRKLSLTSAGAAYLEKCREILNLVEAAETGLDAERQKPRGMIRMSLPLSFGQRFLAPLLLEFTASYPEVELNMDFTDRRANLIEEGIDLAVRITDRLLPQDVVRRLSSTRMVVVASTEYLRRHGEPKTPFELAGHECLSYTLSQGATWPFKIDGNLTNIPVHGRIQANNGDALVQAAIRGLGITYQPTFIALDALNSGELKPILTEFELPEIGIYAALPGNRHIPLRVRMLIDFLIERLGKEATWNRIPLS